MQTLPSSKPSVAWGTDLIDKYRYNLFYKTATHVVGLQVVLALVSMIVMAWSIQHALQAAIDASGMPEGTFARASDDTYAYAAIAILLLNVIFGILIARFALWPTRNSLQFQKKFIGNIAHEIRTPLAIIKTNTEVALFDPKLTPAVRETFADTVIELDRISETINNLLSFDTLTRPRKMTFMPTDIGRIVEETLSRHQGLADSRGVSLIARIKEVPTAYGNATALEQVVTNLVKNAVNYTPKDKGGSVTVTAGATDGQRIAITVKDTGIGIDQKDLFHIFEPFYRGDTSRARGIGTGTSGLGLAIVSEIVRLHKGAISIRSTPGIGTEIRVTLPASGSQKSFPDPLASDTKGDTNEVSVDFS
ncbi:MAG: HAMP domain-containing sensor histidine kinase [Patescibacteria group bacterium]